ncbi:YueI family protein [Halobacillus locisalis]|uniref:YueI family protein n=1 Tax=Halobacillus locisalis TaxID=220753 RepID=UPI0031B575B1
MKTVKKDVDDYLQEGIYGARQTKPGERKKYLGTIRERVVLVLTNGQLMREQGLEELAQAMKDYPEAKLLLDRQVSYRFRKPYRQLANEHGIQHTTVDNKEVETDVGAVLAVEEAIDKEKIDIKTTEDTKQEGEEKKGLGGLIKSLFKS